MIHPTSHDLARVCCVSQGTIDRALNNRPGIAARTRERILQAAARCGYVPHAAARSLATGASHLIGLVLFGLSNQFTGRLVRAIDEAARGQGYDLLTAFTNQDPGLERRYLKRFLERRVDGLILFPIGQAREELRLAAMQKTPVVTLFNRPDHGRINHLRIDERAAMTQLAAWLVRRRCRRVAYVTITVPSGNLSDAVRKRKDSFVNAARRRRLSCDIHESAAMEEAAFQGYDAIACHNDSLALKVARQFAAARRRLPVITGFDGNDDGAPDERLAATFKIPYDDMAREAVRMIHERCFAETMVFAARPLWCADKPEQKSLAISNTHSSL
ncbi:MAG: LacI family DNA-binding transcriptional regulator [Verrucomicrobiae bacterium]|nr:LacI family DNA-binding transcriptional regulator [Verrucomicrobiae bacterium]